MTANQKLRSIARITDTALAPLLAERGRIAHQIDAAREGVAKAEARGVEARTSLIQRISDLEGKLAAVEARIAPLAEVAEAGRWTRFVYVPNGHVHHGFGCSTLRWDTVTTWLPEYSGADEAELVEAAADAACTVCFPTAPVDRPSTIGVYVKAREEREAEAAERAAKNAAAADARIVVGRRVYKTQRGAENEIGWQMECVVSARYQEAVDAEHRAHLDSLVAEYLETARSIAAAVAAKVEGYDAGAILAKKFEAKAKAYRKNGWAIPADAAL